jgi:glutathione S-transferase
LHKGFGPLFKAETPPQVRDAVIEALGKRFTLLQRKLEGKPYLTGERFTIADAYAFVVLNWTSYHKIDIGPWPRSQELFATRQGASRCPCRHVARKGSDLNRFPPCRQLPLYWRAWACA